MLRTSIVLSCLSLLLAVPFVSGCSSDNPLSPSGDDDDDGSTPNGYHFETGGYVVANGEYYHCFFRDVPTGATADLEVGVTRFAYTPDQGVMHHIVIFSGAASEGDTDRDCELLEDGWNPRYAGGTNTDPLVMPDGVAMKVDEVEHLVIQFHYLNVDAPIADNTTVDLDFTEPGEEFIPASLIVSGATDFTIPAGAVDYTIASDCEVPAQLPGDLNVFAVWPHMHQAGKHFRINSNLSGNPFSIWDQAWDFGDQPLARFNPPLVFSGGDTVHTECIYDNADLDNPITYGESSNQEMCFDFFFYYPALFSGPLPCGSAL